MILDILRVRVALLKIKSTTYKFFFAIFLTTECTIKCPKEFGPFLVYILNYQITIDAQLKFTLFPVKNFLSTFYFSS